MTLVIAHRGASAYAPENTLRAFALAQQQGADMCELDVQLTADGVPVVFHDDTTIRWDGNERLISSCTLADLQRLSIGGERVATLTEVAEFARATGMRLNIELKGPGLGAETAAVIRAFGIDELVLISSFWESALLEIGTIAPHLPRAYLMGVHTLRPGVRFRESWPVLALRKAGASVWHPAYQIPLLFRVIPVVRRAGYRVNVWTVNSVEMMRRLIAIGIDGIITDTPDVLRRMLADTPIGDHAV
ncbi:MAG TPA: glycerophosphodiester phosphodiesterase [Roseiflexaceae bacterium]|nr:glycerophosphodiester phosphodiesterase [Roseiflexaceae bacterium]HMP42853.1 glycerophosphodiester phosphodiesterase [Roseiflexaceae bacterium]